MGRCPFVKTLPKCHARATVVVTNTCHVRPHEYARERKSDRRDGDNSHSHRETREHTFQVSLRNTSPVAFARTTASLRERPTPYRPLLLRSNTSASRALQVARRAASVAYTHAPPCPLWPAISCAPRQ